MESKKCTLCCEVKLLTEYAFKSKKDNIKKYYCKNCDKKKRKDFYLKNKDRIIEDVLINNKKIRERNLKFIWEFKKENSCVDCGNNNPIVLEFDHRDDVKKEENISHMINKGYSLENILKEIDKCDVRCANCHKIRTAIQQGWYKNIVT